MIRIDDKLLNLTTEKAQSRERRRMNHNFHETLDANVQRMLNALEPDTYVQPHKHENPDKFESFIILKGRLVVIEFEETGEVKDFIVLDSQKGNYGVEIAPKKWHSIIALEPATVIYEVKDGPYSVLNDKDFATWAPKEGSDKCGTYNLGLLKKCGIA